MQFLYFFLNIICVFYFFNPINEKQQTLSEKTLIVKKCKDFDLNGKGDNPQWNLVNWTHMSLLEGAEETYETKFKVLYSDKGIYVLSYCEDSLITTDYENDQDDIWKGDVFEIFLQTNPSNPLYFEYEINPLNTELVLLIPNNNGDFLGWAPWHYEGDRKVKKAVRIHGGKAETGERISGWTAELFFPYKLFKGFKNVPPKPGTEWNGNFYRMDNDTGKRKKWSWAPIEESFHDYKKFRPIVFE